MASGSQREPDTSNPRHFGTDLVPKRPEDSLDLSAELSHPMNQSFSPLGSKCLAILLG